MTKAKKTAVIGFLCVLTYVVTYYLRNMLSVFAPELLFGGVFNESGIALLSSTYMVFYAIGQLLNGFLGDVLAPKKLIFTGIFTAGVSIILFPLIQISAVEVILFALLGFGLSMVRGPLMKIITENTDTDGARKICVFFSSASFAGPMIAGIFASLFDFVPAFIAAGSFAIIAVSFSFGFIFHLEKKKEITYRHSEKFNLSSLLEVFKIEKFFFYLVIACLVEIGTASISFWIPTYLSIHLGFGTDASNTIFTLISVFRACMPFVALAIFNATGQKDIGMMRIAFSVSAILFISDIFITNKILNIAVLILALMSISCCSSLLWSIYIPSLGKTGRVSSVNGVIDCTGYIAAAAANLVFGNLVTYIGWSGLLALWSLIGIIGVFTTLFATKSKKQ
ncbi:MAG: MFS transporter [Ruminococcaceae bacterium]|nr:MFS transporter [Oscillospiraceae bacterium]